MTPCRGPSPGGAGKVAAALRIVGRAACGLLAVIVLLMLMAGLPTALTHFVGWPLPDHVPTWDEVQVTLLSLMSPQFLLDLLACILWPLWARFTFDVLAAIPDAARAAPWRHSLRDLRNGPLHTVAGVLVGAIVVSILSSRTSTPATAQAAKSQLSTAGHSTVATATYRPLVTTATGNESKVITAAVHTRAANPAPRDTETVRAPEHGVYDSLWRVAQRCLGDGNRWPEIWKLNQGSTQNDGRVFASPNLIHPGWQLRLPSTSDTPALLPPVDEDPVLGASPQPPGPGDQAPPNTKQPPVPAAPADSTSAAPATNPVPGISLSTGAFVGLGLAALITIAMISVRLGRRRYYQPGVPESDDPGRAPIVRALRIAHDSATPPPDDEVILTRGSARPADLDTRERAQATARAALPAPEETVLGIRDGHTVALDLARSRGLGLIGPGAHSAARALIVTLLAQAVNDGLGALVVIPAADAEALFGADLPLRAPTSLAVVDDVSAGLAILEAELLARVRADDEADDEPEPRQHAHYGGAPLVLVASPIADTERRTQTILDNGAGLGLAGILLGQWRPGGTARVRDDGTIGATSPTLADSLASARLFTLPGSETADLLTLLRAAEPTRHDRTQTTNGTVSEGQGDTVRTRASTDVEQANPGDDVQGAHYEFITAKSCEPNAESPPAAERSPARIAIDPAPLHLQVLGRLHLMRAERESADLIEALAPRQRDILVYLALHREGSRREALTAALWPDAPGDRPYNSFHATLSQLRRGLRTATGDEIADITLNRDGHYGLDPAQVTVDLWQMQDALTARRHGAATADTVSALRRVAELYRGDLAESIAADWIDGPREALRREVLDALSALIRSIGEEDPEQTLALLEQARRLDPYNEAIYRDLMRTQARLGQYDSIPRTLRLLTNSLATLDQQPTRDTFGLADFLRRPRGSHLRDREAS